MSTTSIGSITLGSTPHIIGSLESPISPPRADELYKQGVRLFEIRADLFASIELACKTAQILHSDGRFGLLATYRDNELIQKHQRVQYFKELLTFCHAIDIEIDSDQRFELVSLAKQMGKTIMISYHNYTQTPSKEALKSLIQEALALGADIVKVASTVNNTSDCTVLIHQLSECPKPWIAIGMGDLGKMTRVCAPLFGSVMSYGYLEKAVAPGQLSVNELASHFRHFYPTFKEMVDVS
jgi:3-dehydroquinate dehydratase-1